MTAGPPPAGGGGEARGQAFLIAGGAGFVGSHFADYLLGAGGARTVTLYDNFSSGREWHYAQHKDDPRLRVVRGEVEDTAALARAMDGCDAVIHLASNPDIARAVREPTIDFTQGTALTNSVVEAMRVSTPRRLLYASGSGVYGDLGTAVAQEDHGPLLPISTYGASKLAGEVLIASYVYMFGLTARAFRFGNVVGPRQTHGVGFDFAKRLLAQMDPERRRALPAGASAGGSGDPLRVPTLKILGDGSQSKSYVHISDIVAAVMAAHAREAAPFQVYNVATGDTITVRDIAALAVECVGLRSEEVAFEYTGGDRGWKGDVPIVNLDTARIRGLGWRCAHTSREALRKSILAMIPEMKAGRM